MGHLASKDAYHGVARKLDSLTVRTPHTPALRAILEELYTPREAELVARMPTALCRLDQIARVTGIDVRELEGLLEGLCAKGLVIDLFFERESLPLYQVSPFVIGVFEFTMMRTASDADHRRRAHLFREYWETFCAANMGAGRTSIARALPHEATLPSDDHVEVLDYERASCVVDAADRFSVGICSCRHEKEHLGERGCDTPLDVCTGMGRGAEYMIRRGLAREISRTEMHERLARSREQGLVLAADNVQKDVAFICHCCGCCCNILGAVTKYGYPGAIVSSSFEARIDREKCTGCRRCQQACPVEAIELEPPRPGSAPLEPPRPGSGERKRRARVRPEACIGCGVCATSCSTGALTLVPHGRRVLHPADTFERVIVQALQAGTLQNLVFDNPNSKAEGFMRGLLGGFLQLDAVKRALVSERLRSVFLGRLANVARRRSASIGPT